MTAKEVITRSSEISKELGRTYGRLQAELLTPLIKRQVFLLNEDGNVKRQEETR